MYECGLTALDLIEAIEEEADVSVPIPRSVYVRAINTAEQFIYTEILRESILVVLPYKDDEIPLASINVPSGCAPVHYDDILRVFADTHECEKSGASGALDFADKQFYYTDYNGHLILRLQEYPAEIRMIIRIRPSLKDESGADMLAVPAEYVDLLASKMRGEAYKIANEDALAAKWLNEYNYHLENFKVWADKRNRRYGG